MATTYVVTYTLLGKTRSMEVWSDSSTAARNLVARMIPAAVIISSGKRQAF